MKVLIFKANGGAVQYIARGWANALLSAGVTVDFWDGNIDSWHKFNPDLYIGCSGHRQPIPELRRRCKLAIHVNPYCQTRIEPNINESQDAIQWTLSFRPEVVFGYGHETDRHYWSIWEDNGPIWVPMATAGDATIFSPQKGDHKSYDVAYIGGRWAYKGVSLDQFLLPVLQDTSIKSVLYGWGGWPFAFYKGQASDDQVPSILASCKVAPCISEPHTIQYGIDLPERVFKAALSGAVVVHDNALGIERYLPHAIVGKTPQEYHQKIRDILNWPSTDRALAASQQRTDVLAAHTYHHRMSLLLRTAGFGQEADTVLAALNNSKA